MKILIEITYVLLSGLWRRWFGSDLKGFFGNRFVQHIVGGTVAFLYLYFCREEKWVQALLAVLVLQGLFFCIGHGAAFDMSRAGYPDEKTIGRYKKFFWNKWCEFLVPKSSWYGFGYDFLWMFFRYTLPALLISLILWNVYFCFSGLFVAFSYAVCWSLSDKGKLKRLTATELAELFSGFFVGVLL